MPDLASAVTAAALHLRSAIADAKGKRFSDTSVEIRTDIEGKVRLIVRQTVYREVQ